MRIGTDENFLVIEHPNPADPYSPYKVEAKILGEGAEFSALNDAVFFSITESLEPELREFIELKRDSLEIEMTEACALKLLRDSHGGINVFFRISSLRNGKETFLSGDICVPGEAANEVLHDLRYMILA